jgi:hypothetical protein
VTVTLIATLVGLLLGCASAGAVAWCLLFSRSHRKVNNRFVIHLAQLFVVIAIGGGLFLIQVFDDHLGIKRHSSPYYAAQFAYVISAACVMFLAVRAELRWRKSVGLDGKTQLDPAPD